MPELSPFAWCILFGNGSAAFIRHDDHHDQAYVEKRAAELHGTCLPLFTRRRETAPS